MVQFNPTVSNSSCLPSTAKMRNIIVAWMLLFAFGLLQQLLPSPSSSHLFASASSPGMKMSLSQDGLNYASQVAVGVMMRYVRGARIPDFRNGDVSGNDVHVAYVNNPTSSVYVRPGGGLTWQLSNVDARVNGRWRWSFGIFSESGSFETTSSGASLSVDVTVGRSASGDLTIFTTACRCSLNNMRFRVHCFWAWLINMFEGMIVSNVKPHVESQICNAARTAIDSNGAQQLATFQVRYPFLDRWMFDYSLVSPPTFGYGYMETAHLGDFYLSAAGARRTWPFVPGPLPRPQSAGQRAVTAWMDEYTMNVIGHSLFVNKVLSYVHTFDLAAVIPGLVSSTAADGTTFEVLLEASERPTMTIPGPSAHGHFKGIATVQMRLPASKTSTVDGRIVPNVQRIISAEIETTLVVSPSFNGTHVTASASTLGVSASLIRDDNSGNGSSSSHGGSGDIDPLGPMSELTDIQLSAICNYLMVTVVLPKLNEVGLAGLPVSHMQYVGFPNAVLTLQSGLAVLHTDVSYHF